MCICLSHFANELQQPLCAMLSSREFSAKLEKILKAEEVMKPGKASYAFKTHLQKSSFDK